METNKFISGFEVDPTRFSQDSNKLIFNFSSFVLTEDKNVYFVEDLGFLYHLKRLNMLISYTI